MALPKTRTFKHSGAILDCIGMTSDDIVEHADILSTPSLKRGRPILGDSRSRSGTPGRRKSRSPTKSPTKSLVEYIRSLAERGKAGQPLSSLPEVKRKRGRPRKVKSEPNGDDAAPGIDGHEQLKNPFTDSNGKITPRKRGRPRKPKNVPPIVIKNDPDNPEQKKSLLHRLENVQGQEQQETLNGSVSKIDESNGATLGTHENSMLETRVKEEPNLVVKARRGRPRKVQVLATAMDQSDNNLSELTVRRSPRKRQRTVKYTSEDESGSDKYDIGVHLEDEVVGQPSNLDSGTIKDAGASPALDKDPDFDVSVKLVEEPCTPSKVIKRKGISAEHDFTSPLKKAIIDNLNEYKDAASTGSLKLSRNFTPTPLPTNMEKYKITADKSVSAFFDTFEGYFDQKKQLKSSQKSKNTMSMATDITREEFALISNMFHNYLHKSERIRLHEIQKKMFPQYWFELTQGFSLLFYGIGSKRDFLEEYAFEYLVPRLVHSRINKSIENGNETDSEDESDLNNSSIPCVVINGYNPTCNYRDVFKDISQALLPEELTRNETKYWGNHVLLHIQKMIELYKSESPDIRLVIVVHNLDGPSLRKDAFQTMLSYLSLIRQVAIIASVDHIYAPILWDNFKAQNFNFIFHDITNYEPLAVESSFKDVMKMTKNDSASGAEGARFVLQSLTVNSKRMYKLLIETQLSNMEANTTAGKVAGKKRSVPGHGIEFKKLLHLCAADFIASNEISLRSMLTEFIEHKMAFLSKNPGGTEHIWVPYNYSEMKKLLDSSLTDI